jgi:NAD(P)-dependent dehydrogenase (short-subunit alcohol dehydrogenase family)
VSAASKPTGGELDGRTAIITGAASGIGRATAALFAREGAALALVDREERALEELREQLDRSGTECIAIEADVSSPGAAERVIGAAIERWGRLDILVNNAGIAFMGTVEKTTDQEWDYVFATNTTSVFRFVRAAVPALDRTGRGSIVNVASEAGLVGFANYAAYSSSKAAVVNLTRSLAIDYAPDRIRVNCVCPGSIETPLLQRYYDAQADPVQAREEDVLTHPLGIGRPEDVAEGILFLASDRARYVTGHALAIDGGYTIQ